MSSSGASAFPYLDAPRPVAIAHRGSAAAHPENTMAAFQDAVDLGYRYIETDVHATRDGVLVAFHDDRLDRVTDRKGRISELDWAEVSQARVHGREAIPLFDELLTAWPNLKINIDPKADGAVIPLIKALARPGILPRVCVGSFSGRRLAAMRAALGPELCTSMAPGEVVRLRLSSLGLPGFRSWAPLAAAAQVPLRHYGLPVLDGRFVRAAHALGLKVHVWTINDGDTIARLLDLGVDGIMSDETALLKSVFTARGLWPV
jgi:glycerophosphoryl diester phosphodiesterase